MPKKGLSKIESIRAVAHLLYKNESLPHRNTNFHAELGMRLHSYYKQLSDFCE
jgi:hypothetical protein